MTKSSAQTTRDSVAKYRRAGLIQAKVWVHPEEAHGVRLHAAELPKTEPLLEYLKGSKP